MSFFTETRRSAWDTETTGTDPLTDRVVTAAFIVRGGGHPDLGFSWLIDPGVPIPAAATEIHGITDAMVEEDGRDPKVALDEIASTLATGITHGLPVVAFNHAFDWSILHHDLVRNGLPTVEDRVGDNPLTLVDPHVIDKRFVERLRGKGQRKLKPTAERHGVQLEDWHTAEADALAALLIADAQFDRYAQLSTYGVQELFAAQQAWRAEQQAALQEWFRTKATPEQGGSPDKVIDGSWPLIPAQRGGEGS